MYDITSQKSFDNLSKWKEGFIEHAAPQDPKTFPFLVIGNKTDLESDRRVQFQKGQSWAKTNGDLMFFETSAKDNLHVDESFVEIAK